MKRTYGQILIDHFKRYPNHLTYKMITVEGTQRKVYWIATPTADNRTHLQFKNLQQLERYLDQHYKYSIEYTKELLHV